VEQRLRDLRVAVTDSSDMAEVWKTEVRPIMQIRQLETVGGGLSARPAKFSLEMVGWEDIF
jgi:hypothetical protein